MRIRHLALFVAMIVISSLISGFIFGINSSISLDVKNFLLSYNFNFVNIFIIVLLFFLSLSLLGVIGFTFYICLDSISVGYFIYFIYSSFGLKGILFYILSLFIRKGFFFLLIIYLFINSFSYTGRIILNMKGNLNDNVKTLLIPLIKKYSVVLLLIILNEIFVYFIGNKIINSFSFML